MDPLIHERLAVVETKLGAVQGRLDEVAGDLRIVSDYVLTTKATRAGHGRAISVLGGFLVGVASLWAAFGEQIRKFFG